jgi:L-fucose/D-arabinose isomerase
VTLPMKVGLLSTISPEKTWPKETLTEIHSWLVAGRDMLVKAGMDVLDIDAITQSHQQGAQHARELSYRGAEVLVVFIGRWSYSSTIVAIALESHLPVILWAPYRDDTGGIIGASIARGALAEVGIDAPLVHGNVDEPETSRRLVQLCKVRSAAARMRHLTYGVCGGRSLGMYTGAIDPNAWRTQFGIEVDAFDQAGLVTEAQRIPAERVKPYLPWIKSSFGKIRVSDEVLEGQVRLYLAVKDIIEFRGYDFVSLRCLPEMPTAYTTFCLAHALLNDSSDAEGPKPRIISACEADGNGALTMMMLGLLTDGPVGMGDVWHVDRNTDVLRLSNCGSQPTDMAKSRKEINLVPHQFTEFEWKIGACCPQGIAKPGKVTVARLGRVAGKYQCLITTGDALDVPLEQVAKTFWGFSPHIFIHLDAGYSAFMNELRCNHMHVAYGDHKEAMVELCRMFDVKPILI